jgi:hypothetical protein
MRGNEFFSRRGGEDVRVEQVEQDGVSRWVLKDRQGGVIHERRE